MQPIDSHTSTTLNSLTAETAHSHQGKSRIAYGIGLLPGAGADVMKCYIPFQTQQPGLEHPSKGSTSWLPPHPGEHRYVRPLEVVDDTNNACSTVRSCSKDRL